MKSNLQTTLTSLLVGLMIVVLLSYSGWDRWFESEPEQSGQEAQPDLVALSVKQDSFNDKGELQYRLQATRMLQFLDAGHNRMEQPDVLFFRQQTPAWKSTADEAHSDASGEELHLQGNVLFVQQDEPRGAILSTSALTLYPRKSRASTDEKVLIRQPGVRVEAQGLEADLNTNTLQLKHQVTSLYDPEKS